LLTLLRAGEVRVKTPEGEEQSFYVGGGVLEIQPKRVTVLADTAARAKDLDEAAAIAARQRAEEALAGQTDKITQAEALAELTRVVAQLKMIERLRKLKG
jgi:F-type H+-transporting ATPase subunit epsilon